MPRAATPPPVRDRRSSFALLLTLVPALVAGVLLRLWLATRNAGITMDSPLYWRMAQAIGRGAKSAGPAHHGYPALIALLERLLPGAILPGRAVSLLASVLLVIVVYGLARRTLSPWWSSLAAWLVALHPLVAVYSGVVMTESTVLALGYGALLLVEQGRFLRGGLTMGAAYLVRPEALALAPLGALCARGTARRRLLVLAGFALLLVPYVGYLRWERGSWMISPKTVLVRPTIPRGHAAEWKVGTGAPPPEESMSFGERVRWAAPSIARNYGPGLLQHLILLVRSWPWPLLALSLLGLTAWRRALLAPLLLELALPLLAVPFDPRFAMLAVPALAVFAACGASWAAARLASRPRWRTAAIALALAAACAGVVLLWLGQDGRIARNFDDGPMEQMRQAGEWLAAHGRPGARVMDRKAYVPFFAGMEHVQLPDDDYETIVRFAQRESIDYMVLEEYMVTTLRKQMRPLASDPEFRRREKRLRLIYVSGSPRPGTGIAILEVSRDTTLAGPFSR